MRMMAGIRNESCPVPLLSILHGHISKEKIMTAAGKHRERSCVCSNNERKCRVVV